MCHLYLIWFAALENNWLPYLITHTHAWVIVAKSIVNRLHSFEHFLPLLLNFAPHAGFEVLPWAAESVGVIWAQCVLLSVMRATRIPVFICAGCMGTVWCNRVLHFIMFPECCAALFKKKNKKKNLTMMSHSRNQNPLSQDNPETACWVVAMLKLLSFTEHKETHICSWTGGLCSWQRGMKILKASHSAC